MNRTSAVRRVVLSGLAAVGLVALGTTPAMAHVTITPSTTTAGATAVLRVEIPHGCEESATTAISLRVPDGVEEVSATDRGRWAVDQAADGLTWTADEPLPDGEHAEVEFSVRLPDDVGATLVFPVVQRCEEGEAAWTEVAEHGEDHDELERPAPVVVVTGDGGDGDETGGDGGTSSAASGGETAGAEPDTEAAGAASASGSGGAASGTETAGTASGPESASAVSGTGPWGLLTVGAAGLLVAGALVAGAVVLRRRRRA